MLSRTSMQDCIPWMKCEYEFVDIDHERGSFLGIGENPIIIKVNGKEKAISLENLNQWLNDTPHEPELLKAEDAYNDAGN